LTHVNPQGLCDARIDTLPRRADEDRMPEIVTVTLNPAMDVTTSVPRIAPSHKLRCARERRDAGGGGVNVARVVRRLGGDVAAAYPAGGPIGALLERLITAEDVASCVAPIAGDTRESFTVYETETRREYRFVLPGPELSEPEWRACLAAFEGALAGARYMVASGSLCPGVPDDFHARLAAAARRGGVRFVLDASGPALKAALDEGVFLVKPNLRELEDLTGASLPDQAGRLSACRRLISEGRTEMVALTLSAEGALLVTRERAWAAEALQFEVVSSVGAGDSFLGAMLYALAASLSLEDALRYGVAAGAAALLTPGTELCRREDVERLLGDVRISAL
jgi:6-phosphofructokinase 2